jgi:hypothetical protein
MIQTARIRRTNRFFDERDAFMEQLVREVERHVRESSRDGMFPAVRLNGTSDLPWERIRVMRDGIQYPSMMSAFPDVQFYDYTKVPTRRPTGNYHLTFSLSETNERQARAWLAAGGSVAVVFDIKARGGKLPDTYWGHRVVNGDASDVRFRDPRHVIIGLKAKGDARGDGSGFVR